MDIIERYRAYAEAFEETFLDDDWSRIEPFFTEDASYSPGRSVGQGRDAALALLKQGIDDFDRQMDRRAVVFGNIHTKGNEVHVDWTASFSRSGLPDLEICGREIASFEGDRIASLRAEFEPAQLQAMQLWMARYAGQL